MQRSVPTALVASLVEDTSIPNATVLSEPRRMPHPLFEIVDGQVDLPVRVTVVSRTRVLLQHRYLAARQEEEKSHDHAGLLRVDVLPMGIEDRALLLVSGSEISELLHVSHLHVSQYGTQVNGDNRTMQDSDYVRAVRVRNWRDKNADLKNKTFTQLSKVQKIRAYQ